MSTTTAWPIKSRELHSHHFDSTTWNNFQFRPDDIIIATYAKCKELGAERARWLVGKQGA